jgi:hypothetical protein
MRPRRIRDLSWAEDGATREELPKDSVVAFVDLLIEGTVGGAGGGTPLDPALIANRIELLANGKPLYDVSGRELYYLNAALQGERVETALTDPAGSTTPFFLLLRLWLSDPVARQFKRSYLDLRNLESFSVNIDWASIAEIFSGGTQTLADERIRMYYGEVPERGGDVLVVNRKFSYVLSGSQIIEEWKERGATFRSSLVSLFDDSGDPIDTGLDSFGIRVDGKTPLVDELPYSYLRAATTFASGLDADEIPTGIAYVDLDEGSKGQPLQSLDGVNVELLLQGTQDYRVDIVRRQYMPLEAYLGGRARRRAMPVRGARGGEIRTRRGHNVHRPDAGTADGDRADRDPGAPGGGRLF